LAASLKPPPPPPPPPPSSPPPPPPPPLSATWMGETSPRSPPLFDSGSCVLAVLTGESPPEGVPLFASMTSDEPFAGVSDSPPGVPGVGVCGCSGPCGLWEPSGCVPGEQVVQTPPFSIWGVPENGSAGFASLLGTAIDGSLCWTKPVTLPSASVCI